MHSFSDSHPCIQRFDNDTCLADKDDMALADDYVVQFTEGSDNVFQMIFSYKERVQDKFHIFTNNITDISIGSSAGFSIADVSYQQCALIHVRAGSKQIEVTLVFQTTFDCNLFVTSVQAIMNKSMFDQSLTPLPARSRIIIDQCLAQKSESIGWGERYLILIPNKLLIYSSDKGVDASFSRFPRNVGAFAVASRQN